MKNYYKRLICQLNEGRLDSYKRIIAGKIEDDWLLLYTEKKRVAKNVIKERKELLRNEKFILEGEWKG